MPRSCCSQGVWSVPVSPVLSLRFTCTVVEQLAVRVGDVVYIGQESVDHALQQCKWRNSHLCASALLALGQLPVPGADNIDASPCRPRVFVRPGPSPPTPATNKTVCGTSSRKLPSRKSQPLRVRIAAARHHTTALGVDLRHRPHAIVSNTSTRAQWRRTRHPQGRTDSPPQCLTIGDSIGDASPSHTLNTITLLPMTLNVTDTHTDTHNDTHTHNTSSSSSSTHSSSRKKHGCTRTSAEHTSASRTPHTSSKEPSNRAEHR